MRCPLPRSSAVEQLLEKNYRIHCSLHNVVSLTDVPISPVQDVIECINTCVSCDRKSRQTSASVRRSSVFCKRLISVRREPGPWTLMTSWCKFNRLYSHTNSVRTFCINSFFFFFFTGCFMHLILQVSTFLKRQRTGHHFMQSCQHDHYS